MYAVIFFGEFRISVHLFDESEEIDISLYHSREP
jgi:hypothetical protein